MRFTNGIIIFFVIATVGVDEVLSTLFNYITPKKITCWESNCQLRCNDCSILNAGVANNFSCFQYATISVFECSDTFHRVEMTSEFFYKIEKAEVIKITKTDARRIKPHTFPSSTTLREIYLPENNISIIDEWAFGNMSALTHLYLNNNKLTLFNAFTIIDGLSIKYLNLGNNFLIYDDDNLLDDEVYDFKSITSLNLDGNKFRNISMGNYITHRELVKEVSMANNLLTLILPQYFEPLTNLEVLNLAFNKISSITQAFWNMMNLKTLILSHNSLIIFAENDFPPKGHSSLQYLAIDYNHLGKMANIMQYTSTLKKIAIEGNPWYCKCLRQYRRAFHNRSIQEVCADNVEHACIRSDTPCYVWFFSETAVQPDLQVKLDNLVTANNTYYCVLNEFDQ
uniref:Carboxypeptidase N subunit 2-like n=1 Tax=Diabrotica virgifera virgifera TaxID=50390 RepID=A0A6P7GZP7_DIAVI